IWRLIAWAICTWRIWAAKSTVMAWEFYAGILERPLASCPTAHKVWPLTVQAICLLWVWATRMARGVLFRRSSINSLHWEREAPSPPYTVSVKALPVSPFSQYRVANKEQEWMRRLTSSPRGGSADRPCEFLQTVVLPLRWDLTHYFRRNQAGAWRRSKSREAFGAARRWLRPKGSPQCKTLRR